MQSDAALLSNVPDFIQLDAFLKATPSEEAGRRFLFLEASNEDVDHQNEITLQKALGESADYFLRHGNIDLSHYTILGPRSGLANFNDYEIGRPVAARVDGKRTFVKAELYTGESAQAKHATMVWDSMTRQKPASRWYPSVGGAVLAKSMRVDPVSKQKVAVIEKVRWNNIALDRCPVNKTVGEASVVPVGVFAKSMGGALVMKSVGALSMGYATDSAAMSGGRALSRQSLDTGVKNYWDFRDELAKAIASFAVPSTDRAGLTAYAVTSMGVDERQAAGLVSRFLQDLRSLTQRKSA